MTVNVKCYAGFKADERPVEFRLGERDYVVEDILDRWYGPAEVFFKVRANDGNVYILRHAEEQDEWTLTAFRQG
jgi:hypothetical protein